MEKLKYIIEDSTIAEVLGVQNFTNEESAILELVKNAYDAQSLDVVIIISKSQIIIEDNGIGIKKEEQERIFERFYRVDKSHSRETGGTGLGLSIVKHGAILHDAKIKIESTLGTGTKIILEF